MKSDVTVIGLGVMGSALANALIENGYKVTVWNRTRAKAEVFAQSGASVADDVASAVAASPAIVVCVDNYNISRSLLDDKNVISHLSDKVIIQLSTGTPEEARKAEKWATPNGVHYIDGAIMATPNLIGKPDTPIFVSGKAEANSKVEKLLTSFSGSIMYMGEGAGSAAAWDIAVLSILFGGLFGFFHGARVFESEGLPVAELGKMAQNVAPIMGAILKDTADTIHNESYSLPHSTVKTCLGGFKLIAQQAKEAGIDSTFPDFAIGLSERAVKVGLGNEDFASLIKVLR